MSYRTWQQHFGLDPSVIGATFMINQMPYTVAGIAPPGFFGDQLRPDPPDFWMPLATEPGLNKQNSILNHPRLALALHHRSIETGSAAGQRSAESHRRAATVAQQLGPT